jgi:hypothetical protein
MQRATTLARLNRRILETYSQRTTSALRASLPLPLALPWLDRMLALNVDKEVRKDALVIAKAAQAVAAGRAPDADTVRAVLAGAKEIDRGFLGQVGGAPLDILIRYDAVDVVRKARVQRQLAAAYRILAAWQGHNGLRTALAEAFPGAELEQLVLDMLLLYARETQVLGEAVRMPLLLAPLRRRVLEGLYGTMEKTATRLAHEVAQRVRQ